MADNSFLIRLGLHVEEIAHGLDKANEHINGFKEKILDLGKALIVAFSVEKVVEFGKECSELAAKAAGVKNAFSQLPDSVALLEQMRITTHETVSDLDLMGKAVRADNLKIPLEDLGTLLEFAHVRALATNQDFNALADTLLRAIGRGGAGAKRAMAELQISTEDYNKALKETGSTVEAVMKLARESIEKSNGSMDRTNLLLEQNAAGWTNVKIAFGEFLNTSGIAPAILGQIHALLENLSNQFKVWGSNKISLLDKIFGDSEDYERYLKTVKIAEDSAKWAETLAKWSGVRLDDVTVTASKIDTVNSITKEIVALEQERDNLGKGETANINQQIKALQEKIKLIKEEGLASSKPESKGQFALRMSTIGAMPNFEDNIKPLKEMERTFDSMVMSENEFIQNYKDGFNEIIQPTNAAILAAKNLHKAHEDLIADEQKLKQTALVVREIGQAVANAIRTAIDAHQSFSQAMKGIALAIVREFEKIAIGAMATAAAEAGAESGNYYVAIAGVIAGVALIESVFAKIGGSGNSGVGVSASNTRSADRGYSGMQISNPQLEVSGVFTIQGKDLVAVTKNAAHTTSRIGGS